jgi:hypothetical protein
LAVLVTNQSLSGTTYDVLLVDTAAHIVARTSAKLPHLKPDQTLHPSLVSASNSYVYYRDGDTDIRLLSPLGGGRLAKSIPAGAHSIVSFSVSPDDSRIAVAIINQSSNVPASTGRGYVEDLTNGRHHVDLWSNTGADAFRSPVGWHAGALIDRFDFQCGKLAGSGTGFCTTVNAGTTGAARYAPASYHVIEATTGARIATVCEGPFPAVGDSMEISGLPTSAGTACEQAGAGMVSTISEDWNGNKRVFIREPLYDCTLSPAASRMICANEACGWPAILTPVGKTQCLGHYYVRGWIDATHILVLVENQSALAVVNPDSAVIASLPLAQANSFEMMGTVPGAL